MPSQPRDHCTTYIHVPLAPAHEHDMERYYRHALGFGGGYSEFWVLDDGSIRLQFKEVDSLPQINALGANSLANIFLPGHFLEHCNRWVQAGVQIELLLMDPTGYTAVIVDPAMNRIEFRGDFHPGDSGIDTGGWKFFRGL